MSNFRRGVYHEGDFVFSGGVTREGDFFALAFYGGVQLFEGAFLGG